MSAPAERAKAKAEGQKRYFTGKPCVRGHIAERYTASGVCIVCRCESRLVKENGIAEGSASFSEPEPSSLSLRPLADGQVSRVAVEGTNSVVDAKDWLTEQARRLNTSLDRIVNAIKENHWTLTEIEMMSPDDVEQLSKSVREVKTGDGFVRWDDYDPVCNTGEID